MSGRLPRVVLDTNIVVSAMLARGGLESKILRRALDREIRLYTSPPILEEYAEVLMRPKFRLSGAAVEEIIHGIEAVGSVVTPRRNLMICSDPKDNMFLECAEMAGADYLISGNLRHFPPGWKTTRVVSSRVFFASI